jgi:Cu/Ag efflux protein CusF
MKTLVIALFSVLLVVGVVIMPSHASPLGLTELLFAKSSIGGTVESVDPAGLKITILTDVGQKESFPVTDASVLAGLTQGERVFCEMNEDGKVAKIVKATPIPNDFPAPEPKG